ncbi:MAG: methyltransferase domain-containing protein, partial [Acidimicrobiales bacterium]|nr:methyltransferase domain-containing protein [Acidimicrobiales bacterium]
YARAGAEALPFADGAFDAVNVTLVLEHLDDLDAAVAEIARVLAPGGHLVLQLNHPCFQTPASGWIDDQFIDPPEQYWRIGPYLPEAVTVEEVAKDVHVRFVHRPLARYLNALVAAGLLVERMVEPAPPPGFLAQAPEYTDAATVPRLLALRCRKT